MTVFIICTIVAVIVICLYFYAKRLAKLAEVSQIVQATVIECDESASINYRIVYEYERGGIK